MGDKRLPAQRSETTVSIATDKNGVPYPRPILAVDTALLTWDPQRGLLVVEMWRDDIDTWALPGTFVRDRETLTQAVARCLRDKLGVEGIRGRQLSVFDKPDRDHRDWVISVAHVAVVRPEQLHALGSGVAPETRLASVDRPDALPWDHPEMLRRAKNEVRERYRAAADPDRLLGPKFTLRELRQVHEAVIGEEYRPDQFRYFTQDKVVGTGELEENTGSRGRPAQLFRRAR
jgi:8-oxo-dGTP diphosphatase